MTRKRRPRVAFVSHSPWIAGAERVLLNLLQNLPDGKIQPVTIFPLTNGPVKTEARQTLPFPMFELQYGFTIPTCDDPQFLSRIQNETIAFMNLFRELELDAVVVNTAVLYPASAAAVRARIPLVVHCHGALLPRAFPGLNMSAWHSLDVLQYYMADMVLTPSKWVGDHLKAVCKVPESRLKVLFNGTGLPTIPDEGAAKPSPPEFVMLCTLEPHKGVNVFIDAAAHFLSIRPSGARFLVYGEGASQYREVLEARIRRCNLQDHFILCPKQEVDSIYRRCCGVVVTAEFEPFSMVVIEGMSYAKPVIATRCGGPEEIIEDGKTGYLVAVGDSHALAERMLRLVDDTNLRREMGFAGRLRAESVYDIKLIAQEYLDVILSVVDGGHASAATERKRFLEALLEVDPFYARPREAKSAVKPEIYAPISVPTTDGLLSATDITMTLEGLRYRLQEINAALSENANDTAR